MTCMCCNCLQEFERDDDAPRNVPVVIAGISLDMVCDRCYAILWVCN